MCIRDRLKAVASERHHNKRNAVTTNHVDIIPHEEPFQLEETNEIHVRNPNYKGKNYDPNFQTKRAMANNQQ